MTQQLHDMGQTPTEFTAPASILSFEACTKGISVCYQLASGDIAFEQSIEGFDAKHQLPLLLHQCIENYGRPDALATATGPGSFTGLRVCTVAARSMAWLDSIPIYSINSLEALAISAGAGTWLTLMSLKKDTTFHALYSVSITDGITDIHVHSPVHAQIDTDIPTFPAAISEATLIGPALGDKEHLAQSWGLDNNIDTSIQLSAASLLPACACSPLLAWDALLPQYFQASAPEIQRAQKK